MIVSMAIHKFIQPYYGLVILILLSFNLEASQQDTDFNALLQESGLSYSQPDNYIEVAVKDSQLLPYEKALRSADGQLEVRYAVRPLSRMSIDYEDPHSSAPEPNHIFTMMFTALIGNLSTGGNSPHREYKQEQAKEKFNADWAALALFDLEPDYSNNFNQAFLLAMHKNNISDAYMVILFNDHHVAKAQLNAIMKTLAFK